MLSRRHVLPWIVAAAFAVLAALFAVKPLRERYTAFQHDSRLGIRNLVRAVDEQPYRMVAARLSGGFAYRPLRPVHRGALRGTAIETATSELYLSIAGLAEVSERRPDAQSLHAIGLAQLELGESEQALARLQRAVQTSASDAELLSDLAAAAYAQGVAENRMELLLTAIDMASRAHALAPALPAAAFNRALAIEAVHLPEQAITPWNDYLALDGGSGWAGEAREHVRRLQQLVATTATREHSVEQTILHIEEELLPAWGAALAAGNIEAGGAALQSAAADARFLRSFCDDTFHATAVAFVARADASDRALALRLADAHRKFRDGHRLYSRNETTAALPLFEGARDVFRAEGDVFAAKPWKYVAASYMYLGDAQRALRETTEALDFCAANGCSSTAIAHLQWIQAMASVRAGDPQRALVYYGDALKQFEAVKEYQNAATVRALIADTLEFLGDGDEAWSYRRVAMDMAAQDGTTDRIFIAFGEAADAALHREHVVSARLFRDVVVAAARRDGNTVALSDALVWRARITHVEDPGAARRDLDESDSLAATVADSVRRNRLLAETAVARAQLLPPTEAVSYLTLAIAFFESTTNQYRLAELYLARAEAEEHAGLAESAEGDYLRCIARLESGRSHIDDAPLRARYFARSSDLFDRVIRHLWMTRRRGEAFRLAEQSRGREINGGAISPPLSVEDVRAALRDGDALVEYALLADRLVAWVIRSSGSVEIECPLKENTLPDIVSTIQWDGGSNNDDRTSMALVADIVYAPIASAIEGAKRLIIVPNKSLRAVPFAALRDAATGRYLIEDHEVVTVPSAAVYIAALRRDSNMRKVGSPMALVVSYTAGDDSRHLPQLAHGTDEARAVSSLYPHIESLAEEEATPSRFLSRATRAVLVHIVAHAVQREEHPEFSSIVLAPAAEGRDLYASAIAAASLRETRLVFLSTCGTPGRMVRNDAPPTLAESFLAAGVPAVVASLRPVDDAATAVFAAAFHRAYAVTGNAVAALRSAQLECLSSPSSRDPRFWSPWIVIGGAS